MTRKFIAALVGIVLLAAVAPVVLAQQYIDSRLIGPEITRDAEIAPTGESNAICISNSGTVAPAITLCSTVNMTGKTVLMKLPEYTVATLPASHPLSIATDCVSSSDCSTGGGSSRVLVAWDGVDWAILGGGGSGPTPTLESVMTAGNSTTKCTEADPCQFGNGTVYVNIFCDDLNVCYVESSDVSDLYLRARTDKHIILYDEALAAPILTIDPVAATQIGKYTFGTAYKPTKTVDFPAGSLTVDGTQCAQPALATINSGAPRYTILCADNDGSSIYGEAVMPKAWDGLTVTFAHRYVQTAADTGVLNGDIAASCRLATATINNTWGTEIAIDDAAVTGSNAIDITTSAAVTPNGTCTAGTSRLLQFRYQLDAGGTTTAVATLHHLGFTMEYSVTSLSD